MLTLQKNMLFLDDEFRKECEKDCINYINILYPNSNIDIETKISTELENPASIEFFRYIYTNNDTKYYKIIQKEENN